MIYGIIPAAGLSRRMGRPKLTLPLDGRPVLLWVIKHLKAAGIAEILVIAGPHGSELKEIAQEAGAHCHILANATADMHETIIAGLDWLDTHFHPHPTDAWLLAPADHPTLSIDVIHEVVSAFLTNAKCSIFVPVYQGKRGHPTILTWNHVQAIKNLPEGVGLNLYIRSQSDRIQEVEVHTPEILQDLDTPEDYQRLLDKWKPS